MSSCPESSQAEPQAPRQSHRTEERDAGQNTQPFGRNFAAGPSFPRARGLKVGSRLPANRGGGFTLVEVLVAVVIMATVISGSILVIEQGFKSLDMARNTTIAAQIIQSEMENLRLQNWSAISTLPASEAVDISGVIGTTTRPANDFTCSLAASAVSGQTDLMQLTVTVAWVGLDLRSHRLSSSTYYGKGGLYDFLYTTQ
jgi:uncharacterized protein (TIGR02598 family)